MQICSQENKFSGTGASMACAGQHLEAAHAPARKRTSARPGVDATGNRCKIELALAAFDEEARDTR